MENLKHLANIGRYKVTPNHPDIPASHFTPVEVYPGIVKNWQICCYYHLDGSKELWQRFNDGHTIKEWEYIGRN